MAHGQKKVRNTLANSAQPTPYGQKIRNACRPSPMPVWSKNQKRPPHKTQIQATPSQGRVLGSCRPGAATAQAGLICGFVVATPGFGRAAWRGVGGGGALQIQAQCYSCHPGQRPVHTTQAPCPGSWWPGFDSYGVGVFDFLTIRVAGSKSGSRLRGIRGAAATRHPPCQ